MKKTVSTLLALVAASGLQAAGVYGSLSVDGSPPRPPLPSVTLICNSKLIATGAVDARGAFSFGSPRPAVPPCELRTGDAAVPIIIFPSPTRYNLVLTHNGGKATLATR